MKIEPLIKAEALRKAYGKTQALDGASLKIEAGHIWGLLGSNGAGKTTLMKCLLGLAKPDSGTISIAGEDAWDMSPELKARIGYSAQNPEFFPWMSGHALLAYVAPFYPNWDAELTRTLAKDWEIDLGVKTGALSPGNRQKLSAALALGMQPDIIVLDEPAAALDPQARRAFLKAILELGAAKPRTILFSTHITSDLERVADHVAVLRSGKLAFSGELDQFTETYGGNLEDAFIALNKEQAGKK